METENGMTPEEAARRSELQARVDRGVEKLDADLGPIWPSRIDLPTLAMCSNVDCVCGQLFGDYNDGVAALWPDAPSSSVRYLRPYCCNLCHGDEAEYVAQQAVWAAENAANPCHDDLARDHGFLGDDEAGIYYDELLEVWTATIERLRQERTSDGA